MKATLNIKNFGPIKNAELDLRQTTVFIGPQASGKSTIGKLIFLSNKFIYNSHNGNRKRMLSAYFPDSYFIREQTFLYYSKNHKFFKIDGYKNISSEAKIPFYYKKIFYIPSERTFISIASGSFINLINNEVPVPKSILEFGAEFEKARIKRKNLNIDFLNIEYKYKDGEDRIYFGNTDSDFVKLNQGSSGQQNVVPMLTVIDSNYSVETNGTIFVIEEPELNLYPSAQKSLTYHLVNRCTRKSKKTKALNELIITTHSPYILTALNNLLFAYKVAERHPDKATEINQIISQESWINPEDFNAYFVANGTAQQIFNRDTGMISENELDSGSDEILEDFDALMEIYKSPTHA